MKEELSHALNKAAAQLCGYHVRHWDELAGTGQGGGYFLALPDGSPRYQVGRVSAEHAWAEDCPQFCTDRNALPELWRVAHKEMDTFYLHLHALTDSGTWRKFSPTFTFEFWECMLAPAHLHVIAVLKSTGKWTKDLQILWEKEKERA